MYMHPMYVFSYYEHLMNIVAGLLDKQPQLGVIFSYCLPSISCSLR